MREKFAHIAALTIVRLTKTLDLFCRYLLWRFIERLHKLSLFVVKRLPFIDNAQKTRYANLRPKRPQSPSYLPFMNVYYFVLSLFGLKHFPLNEPRKFVFCRLRNGLNDMFFQVDRCASYAFRYNRLIYIDGSKSGFLDDLGRYFTIREREREWIRFGTIDSLYYQVGYVADNIVKTKTRERIVFSITKSCNENILVYEQGIGGVSAINALYIFALAPEVRSHIRQIVEKLGDYDAVHIRHSDYKTDYKPFLKKVIDRARADRKIALCTDSYEVQRYAAALFGDRVVCVSRIPDTKGKTLHANPDLDRYEINLVALSDLFVLAGAKNLYMTQIDRYDSNGRVVNVGGKLSSFGRLAKSLNKRPALLKRLLYGEE
ncbi:MAG: hypothetical protein LBF86_04755 [Helicobacteraceae bacterium]|nr:hypothetical protein [Helicobacteraceae bacterium]